MSKGQAWCQKNRNRIGLFEQEAMMTDLVADVVADVLVPGAKEEALIDLYGDAYRMDRVADANAAATNMVGRGSVVGAGWWCLTGAAALCGVGLVASGRHVSGGGMLGAAALGGSILAAVGYRGRAARWVSTTWRLG